MPISPAGIASAATLGSASVQFVITEYSVLETTVTRDGSIIVGRVRRIHHGILLRNPNRLIPVD